MSASSTPRGGRRRAVVWGGLLAACLHLAAGAVPEFLGQDKVELSRDAAWYVFNGGFDLGEPGQPAPDCSLEGFFRPAQVALAPERRYFPSIAREEDGNRCLTVPGYRGLAEYNLVLGKRWLWREGTVELSFRARIMPDEDGVWHDQKPLLVDFRCRDTSRQYGSVSERYPVLFAKGFRPTREWQTFRFIIPVKPGFRYQLWLRHPGFAPEQALNGLCIDDLSIGYTGATATAEPEVALLPERVPAAWNRGDEAAFAVEALLPGNRELASVDLHLRRDYTLTPWRSCTVPLRRSAEPAATGGRGHYRGRLVIPADSYGSFETVAVIDGRPVFSQGGDLVVLHPLPRPASPLQRRLGAHFNTVGSMYEILGTNDWPIRLTLGLDARAEVFALAGLRHAMIAFDMKKMQPEERRLDFAAADAEMAVLQKYGIEPVGCFGGWWFNQKPEPRGEMEKTHLPAWWYQDQFTRTRADGKRVQVIDDAAWRFHVQGMLDRYGDRIQAWMLPVEPQWLLEPAEYLGFQKTAWELVKRHNPNDLLIAGDATSDVGNNLLGWLEKLHALGFEQYLDCVSFNPYRSSTDYLVTGLGRYSRLLASIRGVLAPGTRLWQQELYYIGNTKLPQGPGEQDVFSGGDAQHHYLLGLAGGLQGITALDTSGPTLYKDACTPSDVCAALNALSWLVSGQTAASPVDPGNQLIRAVLFTEPTGQHGTAALWALQPQGVTLRLAALAQGIEFFDNYGNPLPPQPRRPLGLDPLFLAGPESELRALLRAASYRFAHPLALRCRMAGDTSFVEAQNLSGVRAVFTLELGTSLPPRRLEIDAGGFARFAVAASLPARCRVSTAGDPEASECELATLPSTGPYRIPVGEANALVLKLNGGSTVAVWAADGRLWWRAGVKDSRVTAAPDGQLYNGDALEIFVDRTPCRRLDLDESSAGAAELTVRQYLCAALASPSEAATTAVDSCLRKPLPDSGFQASPQHLPEGYSITASIPLSEALPTGPERVIGMTFEIDRRNGAQLLPKEYLARPGRPSYRFRLHYPLFVLPDDTESASKAP